MPFAVQVRIRLLLLSDAAALREHCFPADTLEQVRDRITHNLRQFALEEAIPLVAEVEGVAAGHALLRRNPHPLRRHRAELLDVVVGGPYQRRGIARRLIENLCGYAARMGIEILETSVRGGEPAEAVYRQLGFREWGRLPRGLVEPWGEQRVFEEVYFWRPVEESE